MLIVFRPNACEDEVEATIALVLRLGYHGEVIGRPGRRAIAVGGGLSAPGPDMFLAQAGVDQVVSDPNPAFLATRLYEPEDSVIEVGDVRIGDGGITLIAGPCAVESETQLFDVAEKVQKRGIAILRAGAYKPRTSPWSFQGLGARGLQLLDEVKRATGLYIATEVVSETTLGDVAKVADLVQIGARNMKNYELLKAVARCGRPVLLKRGADALLSELLLSAEYLLAGGAPGVVLCERGVRGFGDHARNTLDLAVVPAIKRRSHLPILVDPSHGTGSREMVLPLARAAIAAGADGLLVEVHPRPEEALVDGPQALLFDDLDVLCRDVQAIASVLGRVARR